MIFEQFAGNLDNDLVGGMGGDHDENLETQSSLDNNTNQNTGEDRSRFSKSIVSSTQKSDTAGSMTHHNRSQRRLQQQTNLIKSEHERGQSMPKQNQKVIHIRNEKMDETNPLFATEPNSSCFKTDDKQERSEGPDQEFTGQALAAAGQLIGQREHDNDTLMSENEQRDLFENIEQLPEGHPKLKTMVKIRSNDEHRLVSQKAEAITPMGE